MQTLRYATARALPPYAYLPGATPHPVTDPKGHSHGRPEHSPPHLPAERWRENEDYLFGIDLFNAGYFWEAHEAWEGVWKASRDVDQAQATFVQGLILLAAGKLKARLGAVGPAHELTREGLERLRAVYDATGAGYLGVGFMGLTPAAIAEAAEPRDAPPRLRLVL